MELLFKDKIILITGGGRGIGAGLVKAFISSGGRVYFTFKSDKTAATNLSQETGGMALGNQVDSCNVDDIKAFVKMLGKAENKIDVLVNNAGMVPRYLLANIEPRIWDKTISTNLTAVYHYSVASLPWLMKSKNGSIINISSVAADRPNKGLGAYCATKGGIESLTKVLALEYAPYNIRVNTVAPGLIETETMKDITAETRSRIFNRTPLKRFGTVQDVANAVLFLASKKASFITGVQLYVTGGKHLD